MPNIALVVLDTLRKDTFDEHFDWLPGTRYENAYSSSGWTVPAHGTLFTGTYPTENGVYAKHESLRCEQQVLAEVLASSGYTTRGFSANANISDAFEFTRGFAEFHHSWRGKRADEDVLDWSEFISRTSDMGWRRFPLAVKEVLTSDVDSLKSLKLGAYMKARDLGLRSVAGRDDGAEKALDLVENTSFGSDEFLFLNLMEVHTPYDPPEEYRTVDSAANPSFGDTMNETSPQDAETIRQAYDDCARYLSEMYEKIFARLEADFEYVITLSDHGEMFGRDGIWAHNLGVYPELTHVPLAIYDGRNDTTRVTETVGLLDVYPTILSMADVETDAVGRDLRAVAESEQRQPQYFVERHGLRSSRLEALLEDGYGQETIEQYDRSRFGIVREDGTYGWEGRYGFLSSPPADHDDLRARIDEVRAGLEEATTSPDREVSVPADVQNRLEDLGYM